MVLGLARHWVRSFGLSLPVLLAAACGGGGGDEPGEVPSGFAGTVFYQIATGDLNGDGRADVAAIAVVQDGRSTTADPVEVHVLLQDALRPGRFALAQRLALSTPLGAIAVADLDGDMRQDIVVTEPSANRVRIFLQDPVIDGRFAQSALESAGSGLGAVEVTDTNLDQAPDLVVTTRDGVEVLQQDAGWPGTFPVRVVVDASRNDDFALSAEFDSLAVGDFDDNALVDLFTARLDAEGRIYLHEAALPGSFAAALDIGLSVDSLETVAVADIDGDGLDDLIAVGLEGAFAPEVRLRVRLRDPSAPAAFDSVLRWTLADKGDPRRVVVTDVTDDGLADVLVAKVYVEDHGYVEVLKQTGPAFGLERLGIFAPLTLRGVNPYLRGFAVADLNADGLPDMAVADGELSVLFNDPAAPGQFLAARRLLE